MPRESFDFFELHRKFPAKESATPATDGRAGEKCFRSSDAACTSWLKRFSHRYHILWGCKLSSVKPPETTWGFSLQHLLH